MLDRYISGQAERISPEAPVPVVQVMSTQEYLGGAANVSLNVDALGGQAYLLGKIGCDASGEILKNLLNKRNIHYRFDEDPDSQTITKLRVLSHHQQLIRLDFEEFFHENSQENLLVHYKNLLQHVDYVVLSDYGKGTLAHAPIFISLAQDKNKPVLVDPKGHQFDQYAHATLLSPNRKEFEAVVGPCKNEAILIERGLNLLKKLSLGALLITRGAEGMTLIQEKHPPLHLNACTHEVFDVSGAGDTVIATLATALGAGLSLEEAVQLSNTAAGIVVTKLGTATVSLKELMQASHPAHLSEKGVTTVPNLLSYLQAARARHEKIIMTNGCFDLIHAGHVQYLQQAKALGDRLIVAVNTDESIQKLKGRHRPIVPLEQRMKVLAAFEAVDWVVPFDTETPEDLIRILNPDVLVKGEDYQASQIAGADWLLAQGKEVRLLPFLEGCSSTTLIKKIRLLSKSSI